MRGLGDVCLIVSVQQAKICHQDTPSSLSMFHETDESPLPFDVSRFSLLCEELRLLTLTFSQRSPFTLAALSRVPNVTQFLPALPSPCSASSAGI